MTSERLKVKGDKMRLIDWCSAAPERDTTRHKIGRNNKNIKKKRKWKEKEVKEDDDLSVADATRVTSSYRSDWCITPISNSIEIPLHVPI